MDKREYNQIRESLNLGDIGFEKRNNWGRLRISFTVPAILCMICSIGVIFGSYLPFVTASAFGRTISVSLMQLIGNEVYVFVALGTIGLLFGMFRIFCVPFFCGLGSLGMFLYKASSFQSSSALPKELTGLFSGLLKKGTGVYVLLAASIGLILISLLGWLTCRRR